MAYQKNVPSIGRVVGASVPAPPSRKIRPHLTESQINSLRTASEIALAIIAVAGEIALSVVAPNVLQVIGKLCARRKRGKKLTDKETKAKVAHTFYYLRKSGLIDMKPGNNDLVVALSDLGKEKVPHIFLNALTVAKPKAWDGKWWQIAADIPTKEHRRGADLFRKKIKRMGFYPLQRTLWLYPFDPREEIRFVVEHFGISQFVTVMEISRMDREDESRMKDFFKASGVL